MPLKGFKHSDKTKEKISASLKGCRQGFKHSGETKTNISAALKGCHRTDETKQKMSAAKKGHTVSENAKQKIRQSLKGNIPWNKGTHGKYSKETIEKMRQSKLKIKGGVTPKNNLIRHSLEYKLWRNSVFERDDYTCRMCATKGGKLNAHHMWEFAKFPELRFAINNGLTLCLPCHGKVHGGKIPQFVKRVS